MIKTFYYASESKQVCATRFFFLYYPLAPSMKIGSKCSHINDHVQRSCTPVSKTHVALGTVQPWNMCLCITSHDWFSTSKISQFVTGITTKIKESNCSNQ